jgi:hypothetical protein
MSTPSDALEVGPGEDQMLVAGEDGVDAVDLGELQRGVLHPLGRRPAMPEWESAMTMSAPSSFICGTQASRRLRRCRACDLAGEVAANPRS